MVTMAQAQRPIWIESETPTTINTKAEVSGWGFPDYLSNGKWLHISVSANKVASSVPQQGVTATYGFTVTHKGDYHIWNRLGYERVRSTFSWRIDNDAPVTITPQDPTTDLVEMQPWNEIAWLDMGTASLLPGPHRLTINIPASRDDNGHWKPLLYASDCLCLCRRQFYPHGKYPPGIWPQTATDIQAAHQVFQVPRGSTTDRRITLPLKGLWQVTRSDEAVPSVVNAPIADLPQHPYWSAIPVPSDKNTVRPDLLFAHRLWYRTQIAVPKVLAHHSFYIVFPQNNLNTTVFVNGKYCGFNPNPFVRFHIDITRAIHPGINVLMVGIRDAWYGFETEPGNPSKLRDEFNLPISYFHDGFQHLAYPIWNNPQSGILATPTLVCAGRVYTSNIFILPDVLNRTLTVHVDLRNRTGRLINGDLACTVHDLKGNDADLIFPEKPFTVMPFSKTKIVIKSKWQNAHLWTPQSPFMYSLHSTVYVNHEPVDRGTTRFGFRQWSIKGTQFMLNGHPFHGWQDNFQAANPISWLKLYKKYHETMYRFWGTSWMGMSPDRALSFFDRHGIVVRRQGMLDGEAIGYMAIEDDPVLQKLYHSPINMELMHNWRRQVTAEVRGERNHPSIMIWSIENEFLYINCINLYRNLMNEFEAAVTKTANAVMQTDPTRPVMVDGGGACKLQTLPVCGNHYIDGKWTEYPDLAYEANVAGGGRNRWVWDQKRPRFVGEDYFMTGNHPGLSAIGGELAQTGKEGTLHATALVETMLQQGYRWAGYGAWDFYDGPADTDGTQYNSFMPCAVFCREWNWTFASAEHVIRRFGIFNDSVSSRPITFTWRLYNHSREMASRSWVMHVAPGRSFKFNTSIDMPVVESRTNLILNLSLTIQGKRVFVDTKAISVLPPVRHLNGMPALRRAAGNGLYVYDPAGTIQAQLTAWTVPYQPLPSLTVLPPQGRVLLIGSNALAKSSIASQLRLWASVGRSVIVLEQDQPLSSAVIPRDVAGTANSGSIAFGQDYNSPVLAGLRDCDFFTWGPHTLIYNSAYLQPKSGAQSLIECGKNLKYSALIKMPTGKGRFLLCQLSIESHLSNAVARRLLFNLLTDAFLPRTSLRPTFLCASAGSNLSSVVAHLGILAKVVASPLQALAGGHYGLAIIAASHQNLQLLASHLLLVRDYTNSGGWIVLNGLTPNGLASYNKIVGYDHMIRPFRREKVLFTYPRNNLTAGMSAADLAMYSDKRIFSWTAGNYVSQNEFRYVVSTNDAAPFAAFNNPFYFNIVNGFVSSDGWPLIVDVPVPKSGPLVIDAKFPADQTLDAITYVGNTMYWPTTHITLRLLGHDRTNLGFEVPADNLPHRFNFNPVTASHIQLLVDRWLPQPGVGALVGIDNINLWIKPSATYIKRVKPMVADGGMVEYPEGRGGIVLCNLWFKKTESVPINVIKKQRLFGALLQNLHADVVAGTRDYATPLLKFIPVNIATAANAYTGSRGWFGDAAHTFQALPKGTVSLGGVEYSIYTFATSPVPTCVITGAASAKGTMYRSSAISVSRPAPVLYFLQTAKFVKPMKNGEEVGHYLITYADGIKVRVPLRAHVNIDNYEQKQLVTLSDAQPAWVHRWRDGKWAEAFNFKWNNPRPSEPISTVQLLTKQETGAGIAVLAISASGH